MARLIALVLAMALSGCVGPCGSIIYSCKDDDDCYYMQGPRGRCLDDRATGHICAYYFDSCPTKLKWDQCAGANDVRSPWAARCVRPEFLPDSGDAAPDAGADGGDSDLLDAAMDAPPG